MLQAQYEEEKNGTDEILKALVKMDAAEKELWSNYNDQVDKNKLLEDRLNDLEEQNQGLTRDLNQKWQDL